MSDSIKVGLLVVDDEQSIRKLCMTIGNSLGYTCSEAESVETAVARIEHEAPDLWAQLAVQGDVFGDLIPVAVAVAAAATRHARINLFGRRKPQTVHGEVSKRGPLGSSLFIGTPRHED